MLKFTHSAFGEDKGFLGMVGHWEEEVPEYAYLPGALEITSCNYRLLTYVYNLQVMRLTFLKAKVPEN